MSPPSPQLLWRRKLQGLPRGLTLARERGWLAAWDDQGWLYLFDRAGQPQAQQNLGKDLTAACLAEDGSCLGTASHLGVLRYHHPDLAQRWEKHHARPLLALACSPLGHVVAAADDKGQVLLFNSAGDLLGNFSGPRPLNHLALVPEKLLVVGSADLGLTAAFDVQGTLQWRGAVVAHVGGLSVDGAGARVLLACYSEGLLRLDETGKTTETMPTPEPCRLVCQSYDGQRILVGGMNDQIWLLDRAGEVLHRYALDVPFVALALDSLGNSFWAAQTDGHVSHWRLENAVP